jgi:focal adhesion kinase 1
VGKSMDELGVNRGFSPHFSPSRNLTNMEFQQQQQLYIHLPNHGFRMIRIDEAADVRNIVESLVGSMSHASGVKPNAQFYSLRLRHSITREVLWLPQSKFINRIKSHYNTLFFSSSSNADTPSD